MPYVLLPQESTVTVTFDDEMANYIVYVDGVWTDGTQITRQRTTLTYVINDPIDPQDINDAWDAQNNAVNPPP